MAVSEHDVSLEDLTTVIRTCPVIDNHAHNLLVPAALSKHPFLGLSTEATGPALEDAPFSLQNIRARRQLAQLYGCQDEEWEDIVRGREAFLRREGPDELAKRCFEGTHTLLLDDLLVGAEDIYPYHWHDRFTMGRTKRIVRIEVLAQNFLKGLLFDMDLDENDLLDEDLSELIQALDAKMQEAILAASADAEVVGFKSVICYRTGLDIQLEPTPEDIVLATRAFTARAFRHRIYRLEDKPLNDLLVLRTLETLSIAGKRGLPIKPIQFHTGLGDNDINLVKSNPAYLQPLIEKCPQIPIVILHSAYPYTREAGYLATVFANVYLDIGEVFPMVSRSGQEEIVRQSLELVPGNKLLWSTDGHLFPETFWLANLQIRQALEVVIVDFVKKGDLSIKQAIKFVQDFYFNNSNKLYDLSLTLPPFINTTKTSSASLPARTLTRSQPATSSMDLLDSYLATHATPKTVCLYWFDYMGLLRARYIPLKQFTSLLTSTTTPGVAIARGNLGTLQNDGGTPAINTTGQIYVQPDLKTITPPHHADSVPWARVTGSFVNEDGLPLEECPRARLAALAAAVSDAAKGAEIKVGFEIEVVFLKKKAESEEYVPWMTNHAWATQSIEQYPHLHVLQEMADALAEVNIEVTQFHSESIPGQYEFILPPLPPIVAVDTLVLARQVIAQIASAHDLRATFHPQPYPDHSGTASHAHISLNSPMDQALDVAKSTTHFFAGILEHLSALCAFTLPQSASYGRIVDDAWTGGTWIAWGTQNRETPLRRINETRWEVKCLDGIGNMYLALGALFGAGLLGLKHGLEMKWKDCTENPSRLTDAQRQSYGIDSKLPTTLESSLKSLEGDEPLRGILGETLVTNYISMKRAEREMLEKMDKKEKGSSWKWLVERY